LGHSESTRELSILGFLNIFKAISNQKFFISNARTQSFYNAELTIVGFLVMLLLF
jgi:hypothetical protein